jgi:hypothetical protein
MADENANPPPNDTTTTPPAETPPPNGSPPSGERTFTQADVDRIVKERLARANQRPAETARTSAQTTAATTQSTQPQPSTTVTFDADAFNDALSEFPFDKEQRRVVRDAARRENPADMDSFVANWGRMFGKAPGQTAAPPTTTPAAATTAPKTTPQAPPVTGAGAPANSTTVVTDDTPILRMSEADRIALRRRIGDGPYVDRMRKEFRQGNVRVKFGR